TFPGPGTYYACLTVSDSSWQCYDSTCVQVVIPGCAATANISYNVNGNTVSFQSGPTGINNPNYYWYFQSGSPGSSSAANPTTTFPGPGTYYACLTVSDSSWQCYDSTCVQVVSPIQVNCQAAFTAVASGNYVYFNDQSTGSGNIIGWSWTFGDGNTSNQQHPWNFYQQAGTYPVCLTILTSDSCTSTYCDSITVGNGCPCGNASFTYTVSGNTVNFTNTSPGCFASSYWTFGTGDTSWVSSPTYTYNGPGTYNVCLCIYDANGNLCDIQCQPITIGNGCDNTASFTHSTNGLAASFYGQIGGNPDLIIWEFGDASPPQYTTNAFHQYSQPGTYNVCLYVSDSGYACVDTFCQTVTVYGCNLNAGFLPFVNNYTVSFTNNTNTNFGSYFWSFGDGNISYAENPTHTYTSPGTYWVCLSAYDSLGGCWDSTCVSINITGPLSPNWNYSPLRIVPESVESYPNPTRGTNTLQYELGQDADVTVEVFSANGTRIERILDEHQTLGQHRLGFDASDLPSGIYIYKLRAGDEQVTQRFIKQ
ncbi:MAG: PKD domain-containing protein, partial [Bacteroidota bacterium]